MNIVMFNCDLNIHTQWRSQKKIIAGATFRGKPIKLDRQHKRAIYITKYKVGKNEHADPAIR
jgi:hypothetical protein